MRTAGTGTPGRGGFGNPARNSSIRGHFRGFFALATSPSQRSSTAYARSPRSPQGLISATSSSSPSMDLTGYRHSDTTAPMVGCVVTDMAPFLSRHPDHLGAPVRIGTATGSRRSASPSGA